MMKTTTFIFAAAALSLVVGCATPYQSTSFRGGYSETALAPDIFRVIFRGNGYTSPERAQDFALLRASELTLQRGFTCFAIFDERISTTTQSFTTPGYAHTTASGTGYSSGNIYLNPYGGSYSGTSSMDVNATTTYSPPQTYVFYKPQTGLLIKAFQSKPEGIFTFDAGFLQQSVKQKYGIK
jgi:hypothetical protein